MLHVEIDKQLRERIDALAQAENAREQPWSDYCFDLLSPMPNSGWDSHASSSMFSEPAPAGCREHAKRPGCKPAAMRDNRRKSNAFQS